MPELYGARLAVGLGDLVKRPVNTKYAEGHKGARIEQHWKNTGCSVGGIVISTDCTKCPLDMCRYDTRIKATWADMLRKGLRT